MKSITTIVLSLFAAQIAFASEFEGFKDLYVQAKAPESMETIKTFLGYKTQCMGMNKEDIAQTDPVVLETKTIRQGYGPAFPPQTLDVIMLGKSHYSKPIEKGFKATLDKTALKLETFITRQEEDCSYDICTMDVQLHSAIVLNIRMNGNYLVYHDQTREVYGYCW